MKKTKVIVKKKKASNEVSKRQPRQKQKQKQNVNVNVNIDQSKRTTQRKPKGDKPPQPPQQPPINFPPPVFYQPPPPPPPPYQFYGLAPVANTSDSLRNIISKEENAKKFESLIERRNNEPSFLNLNPVSTMSNPLGESIRKEEAKKEFTIPRGQKITIENDDENTNDTIDEISLDVDEQLVVEQNDDQEEVVSGGGGGGAVVTNPQELTQRQINLSKNNQDRKAKRPFYTPTDLKKMNLGELQSLATYLNISLENTSTGSGTGRGAKRNKTMATLITDIQAAQEVKSKAEQEKKTLSQDEIYVLATGSGKPTKKV